MPQAFDTARGVVTEVRRGDQGKNGPYCVIEFFASRTDGRLGKLTFFAPKDKLNAYGWAKVGACVEGMVEDVEKGMNTYVHVQTLREIEGGEASLAIKGK